MTRKNHGGNLASLSRKTGFAREDILDFSANINPLGFPECVRPVIARHVGDITHYPDPDCSVLADAFCKRWGVAANEILFGNGSEEILYLLPKIAKKTTALIPVPSYSDYATACELSDISIKTFILNEHDGFILDFDRFERELTGNEIVFLGNPANPTGFTIDTKRLCQSAVRKPEAVFVVDEAFADFVEGLPRLISSRPDNVIVTGSFTKFYAVPGLRLGYVAASPDYIKELNRIVLPWSVNALAQAVGETVLSDKDFEKETRQFVNQQRNDLLAKLRGFPNLTVYPGKANYLLARIDMDTIDAPTLAQRLLRYGIAIRVCDTFVGLDKRFFRIAIRTETENGVLIDALASVFETTGTQSLHGVAIGKQKKKPSVMFQGTGSNAGKSILTAAFCRVLFQDGYTVAPFKSQNMSLNSFVTYDGGEMGRAQVVQAQACRISPDVRMNPILLKPNSDTGSQVIVLGNSIGNMDIGTYVKYKPEAFGYAKKAYDELAAEFDVIVLEGAGSPAEVNLKSHDIVNMAMARYAASKVLLVGDIDRGGVFASFVGTMEVLSEWERRLVAGFVVNRFRGEGSLLADAFRYVRLHTGLPTYGVVPYIANLGLPEEDSVTFKDVVCKEPADSAKEVDIAVIDLPHISNFTDLDPLRFEPDVRFRIIRRPADIGIPDVVILPGSKNVMNDIDYILQNGFAEIISKLIAGRKTEIIGLCGGLQMLGEEIADPYGIESTKKRTSAGLRFLPVSTVLMGKKSLKAAGALHVPSGMKLRGYEIHHGETKGSGLAPLIVRDDGETIGYSSTDGLVWGTYLHGVFDTDEFRRWFIDRIRTRKGLRPLGAIVAPYDLEPALNRLADVVREHLDVKGIYRMMGLL